MRRRRHGVGKFGQSLRKHWMSAGQIFLVAVVASGKVAGYESFVCFLVCCCCVCFPHLFHLVCVHMGLSYLLRHE